MKKILFVFAIASVYSFSAIGQKQTSKAQEQSQVSVLTNEQKMASVKNCPELLRQLSDKFGKDFSLEDPKVITQLKGNITDNNVAPVIKKLSIFLINNTKSN